MIFGKYINTYYKKYWYLFLFLFLADAIVDIVQLAIPLIIGNIVSIFSNDDLIKEGYNTNPLRILFGFTNEFTTSANEEIAFYQTDLFTVIIAVLIIGFIIFFGRMGWRFFSSLIGANVERDLRRELFIHIQKLPLDYYSDKKVGGLLSYFTNDVITIKQCFTDAMIFAVDLFVLGTCCIIQMALLSWQITIYTCLPLLLFIVLGKTIGGIESKKYKISSDAFEEMSDYTEENLQGFSIIKSFRKEKERALSFKKYTENCRKTSISYLRYSSLIDLVINIYLSLTFFLLFFLSAYAVIIKGDCPFAGGIKDVGDISKFAGYYDLLIWPMIAGGLLIDYISRGNGARKRIASILDSKSDMEDGSNTPRSELNGDIEFSNLNFAYPDSDKIVLKDITFKVKRGETVGIVGKTGSGKSTLVSLIPKLYNLERGQLSIDSIDIVDWRKEDIRKHLSIVLQEAFLFSGTIEENIAFSSDSGIDEKRVIKASEFAAIDTDINLFHDGYKTIVKEKGTTLSGGQRQRVSIARAIYKNPKILILDDSLSAVDADTEKSIMDNIKKNKDITTFIISSRLSAIEDCDLILVMDHGRIIAQGKHDELLLNCKLYSDIYQLQNLEKEMKNG